MPYSYDSPFRFYDNREKYLFFVSTCSEKQVIADRIALDIKDLRHVPPALRVFDAGMGDATVLTRLMRNLHHQHLTVPFLIVGKEISQEDIRISLEKMADTLYEHPLTVLVLTNMLYSEAPWLQPRASAARARLNWLVAALEGSTAFDFDEQIRDIERRVQHSWKTTPSERTGNPLYVTPFGTGGLPQRPPVATGSGHSPQGAARITSMTLVVAAQPFRARLTARARACSPGTLPGPRGQNGRHTVHGQGPGNGNRARGMDRRAAFAHAPRGSSRGASPAAGGK